MAGQAHIGMLAAAHADLAWRRVAPTVHMVTWRRMPLQMTGFVFAHIAAALEQAADEAAYEHAVAVAYDVPCWQAYTKGSRGAALVGSHSVNLLTPVRNPRTLPRFR